MKSFNYNGQSYRVINTLLYQVTNSCLVYCNTVSPELACIASKYGYTGLITDKVDHFHTYTKQATREFITK